MDNIKNDSYYIEKIVNDLRFISFHMADVTLEEFGKNDILLDSMMFRMIQISENSKRLTDGYKLKKQMFHGIRFRDCVTVLCTTMEMLI